MEAQSSKSMKRCSQVVGGSEKKRKGSKDTGEEVLMLTKDDLNEIANTVTFATEGIWLDMEVQYKTALEAIQVCIHELKVQLSLIQVSVTQAS